MMRLIRIAVFTATVLTPAMQYAATVQWNYETIFISYGKDAGVIAYVFLPLFFTRVGDSLEISTSAYSYMEFSNTYLLASEGDTVSHDYIESRGEYFAYARQSMQDGDEMFSHSDYSLTLSPNNSIFLAFRSESYDNGRPEGYNTTYGWIEMALDDEGLPYIVSSARDLDGDPITISPRYEATPEPSGGAMLALGFAALALRRRRR